MGGTGYGGGGRGRVYTYRYTVTTRMTCIKIGSDESHFNVSLIVRDKVTRQCPQTTIFEEKGEPKRYRTEFIPFTSLPPYSQAKPALFLLWMMDEVLLSVLRCQLTYQGQIRDTAPELCFFFPVLFLFDWVRVLWPQLSKGLKPVASQFRSCVRVEVDVLGCPS